MPAVEEPAAPAEINKRETIPSGPAEVIALQRRLLRVHQDVSDDDAPFDPPDAEDVFGFAEFSAEEDAPFDAPDLDDDDVFGGAFVPEPAPVVEALEPAAEPEPAPELEPAPPEAAAEAPLLHIDEEEPVVLTEALDEEPPELLLAPANENAPAPAPPPAPEQEHPRPLAAVPRPNPVGCEQAVPPITIHASWDRAEIGALVAALAADRRLARAEVSLERGGIDAAIVHLEKYESPDLLIIDSNLAAKEILDSCNKLGRLLDPATKVIVVGAVNDIALLRELTARGVKYVVPPIRQDDLIRCVCSMYAEADKSRVIAVIGARGGVGASTIAHNVAWSIAERQESAAALVDLDLSFGAAGFALQLDAPHSIADVVFSDEPQNSNVDRVMIKRGERLQILTAPAKVERPFDLEGAALENLIASVRRTSAYVVLDLPHVWDAAVKQALVLADDIIIVAGPDLASLRNADNMMKWCRATRGKRSEPFVALSMVGVPKRPEIALKDFIDALNTTPIASFAYDPTLFGGAALKGQMIGEAAPQSKTARLMDSVATALTGREPVKRKKPPAAPQRTTDMQPTNVAAPSSDEPKERVSPVVLEASAPAEPPSANENAEPPKMRPFTFTAPAPEPPQPHAQEEEPIELVTETPAEAEAESSMQEDQDEADAAPAPANDHTQPQTEQPVLELVAPVEHDYIRRAREAAEAELAALEAPVEQRSRPSRRLMAAALGLFVPVLIGAWYFENRSAPASAAEPRAAAAATLPPAPHTPTTAELAHQYQTALALLADGGGDGLALLRRTADTGYAPAQYRLAKLYETGEGVEADLAIARRWTERAAGAGNVRAMHDLGVYFARGEGGPVDETAAFRWFRQAAEFGVADSQYNLGSLYAQGRGVAANVQEALFWFSVAAAQGDAAAAARVSELADSATMMDVEQARARAEQFAPRSPEANANEPAPPPQTAPVAESEAPMEAAAPASPG